VLSSYGIYNKNNDKVTNLKQFHLIILSSREPMSMAWPLSRGKTTWAKPDTGNNRFLGVEIMIVSAISGQGAIRCGIEAE